MTPVAAVPPGAAAGGVRTSRGGSGEGDTPAGLSHGTVRDYQRGCHCDLCKEAKRLHERARRAKALKTGVTHGIAASYDVGCRCTDCRTAKRLGQRRIQQRKYKRHTELCHVCMERVGLYPDGSIVQHGRPVCPGSHHVPRPKTIEVLIGYWRDYAACLGMKTELFYPAQGQPAAKAKRTCKGCPVQAECLNDALITNEKFGIRGGLSEHERRRLRRAA